MLIYFKKCFNGTIDINFLEIKTELLIIGVHDTVIFTFGEKTYLTQVKKITYSL